MRFHMSLFGGGGGGDNGSQGFGPNRDNPILDSSLAAGRGEGRGGEGQGGGQLLLTDDAAQSLNSVGFTAFCAEGQLQSQELCLYP